METEYIICIEGSAKEQYSTYNKYNMQYTNTILNIGLNIMS